MSTTGRRELPGPRSEVRQHLMRRPKNATPDELMEYGIKTWKLIGSPGYPKSREKIEDFLHRVYERGVTSEGVTRQMLAIMASPDRVGALAEVKLPALVLHGDQDPLVPLACGEDTAKSLANATLHVYPGMGHDLPDVLIEDIAGRISSHARSADNARNDSRAA
jgi:proline iminopeptidase